MPYLPAPVIRRSPALLLLGLLALLLWGQCAGLLYPKPPAHFLAGYATSVDSLRTRSPATLYLTLALHNKLRQPVILYDVEGALRFSGRTFPFSATSQLHHTSLAPGGEIRQAVAIAVPLPPDSLALLWQRLQTNHPAAPSDPRLSWQTRFATGQRPALRILRHMQPYIPSPQPGAKAAGLGAPAPTAPH